MNCIEIKTYADRMCREILDEKLLGSGREHNGTPVEITGRTIRMANKRPERSNQDETYIMYGMYCFE